MSEWALKRFWKSVQIVSVGTEFEIHLDERPVRTPAKQKLIVPSRTIADHIAAEWEAQIETVDPTAMPWTRSANAAIDKVASQTEEVRAHLAGYADTDLLLYRAEGPASLVERQSQGWDPILDWLNGRYDVRLKVASGVMPVSQDAQALASLTGEMNQMSNFQLTGFHDLVTLSGSFSLALAVTECLKSAEEIWHLSRLDEDWQIEHWGHDEEASVLAKLKMTNFLHAEKFFRTA